MITKFGEPGTSKDRNKAKPRLLLADDHELMVQGLRSLLVHDFDLVATVNDGRAAVAAFDRLRPDLLLLDVALPLLNGIEAARQVKLIVPEARIIFVTMHADPNYVEEAFRVGACGYVLKHAAAGELIDAINRVLDGGRFVSPRVSLHAGTMATEKPAELFGGRLTPRQREVLQLIAEGKTMKEIAEALHISVRTVEFHKNSIVQELGLRTTAELTRYALHRGISGS